MVNAWNRTTEKKKCCYYECISAFLNLIQRSICTYSSVGLTWLQLGKKPLDLRDVCFYLSKAELVGMLRAKPLTPVCWKYGMQKMLSAITATESGGLTKKPCLPRIMLRSWRADRQSRQSLLLALYSVWKKKMITLIWFLFEWIYRKRRLEHTHPIAVKRCTKVILSVSHAVNQICRVSEVGIWVLTPEVLHWDTVDGRIDRTAKLLTDYSLHIWP